MYLYFHHKSYLSGRFLGDQTEHTKNPKGVVPRVPEAISFERLTDRLKNDLFNVETTEKTKPLYLPVKLPKYHTIFYYERFYTLPHSSLN